VKLSHGWDRGVAVFDDVNLVSCAGLVPVLELAEQTGLAELLDEHVRFTSELVKSGAANPTPKLTSIITGAPTVSVTVTNTGTRPSREVVQVYFKPAEVGQPVRLVGWHAVTVEPGASAPGGNYPALVNCSSPAASETSAPRSPSRRPRCICRVVTASLGI
jgi:hypothetical protein